MIDEKMLEAYYEELCARFDAECGSEYRFDIEFGGECGQ